MHDCIAHLARLLRSARQLDLAEALLLRCEQQQYRHHFEAFACTPWLDWVPICCAILSHSACKAWCLASASGRAAEPCRSSALWSGGHRTGVSTCCGRLLTNRCHCDKVPCNNEGKLRFVDSKATLGTSLETCKMDSRYSWSCKQTRACCRQPRRVFLCRGETLMPRWLRGVSAFDDSVL